MTKLVVLGSGSAIPDPERANPSQAIVVDDTVLLFDCGERTSVNLVRAGINPLDVDALFFTHMHWDHISDFGYFAISSWNCGRRAMLPIFGPAGTAAMVEATLFATHAADVAFLRAYVDALPGHVSERPSKQAPFEVEEIDVGYVWRSGAITVTAGDVEHHQRVGMPSVGYRIETPDGVVAISGDTAPCDGVIELARGADVLVHDAAFLDEIIDERGMWSHSSSTGAGKVAAAADVKTLVLTHLGPYTSAPASVAMARPYYGGDYGEEIWDEILARAKAEFAGEVILGYDGLVVEVGGSSDGA